MNSEDEKKVLFKEIKMKNLNNFSISFFGDRGCPTII
jgi:hypothetical protein